MTENNKPEWFEIAESDGPARPQKVRTTLPIAAVMAAALIIGVGAVVAQTQESTPANATSSEVVSTPSDEQVPVNDETSNNLDSGATTVSPSATPSTTGLANPSIAKLPSKGEHEEGEHGDRPHGPRPPHHEHEHDDDEDDDDEMKAPVIPQG